MIKKIIITLSALISLLLICYVSISWYTGTVIEKNFDKEFSNISTKIAAFYNKENPLIISYSDYDRGIFSTSFKLKVLSTEDEPLALIDYYINIYHGPFPWAAVKSGSFSPKFMLMGLSLDGTLNTFATTDYNENIDIIFTNSKKTELIINDMFIGPYHLVIRTNNEFEQFTAHLKLDQFSLDPAMVSNNIFFDYNRLTKGKNIDAIINIKKENNQYKVDHKFNAGQLIIEEMLDRNSLILNQVSLSGDSQFNPTQESSRFSLSIAQQQLGVQNVGTKDLGKLETRFSYIKNPTKTFYNMEYLNWQIGENQLNANLAVDLSSDEDINDLNLAFKAPAAFFSDVIPRIFNSEEGRTEADIILWVSAFEPNFVKISTNKNTQTTLSSDIHYSEKDNKIMVNGKPYTLEDLENFNPFPEQEFSQPNPQ